MGLGDKIRYIRTHFKLSQEDFAEYIRNEAGTKTTAKTVSNYEIDFNVPSIVVIQAIVRAFKVNSAWFFDQAEDPFIFPDQGSLISQSKYLDTERLERTIKDLLVRVSVLEEKLSVEQN